MPQPLADPELPRPLARSIRGRILLPVDLLLLAVLIACAVTAAAGGEVPAALQYAPFVVSLVVLGLPHGAVDHLVPARLGIASRRGGAAAVVLLYLLLGAGVLAAWALAPAATFVGFILLTWLHWGQGDLFTAAAVDGIGRASRPGKALLVVTRGAVPMLVPLVAHPDAYRAVLSSTTTVLPSTSTAGLGALFTDGTRGLVAVGLGVLVVAGALALLRTSLEHALVVTGESLLLVAYFAVVPPVLAVGLYFCFWHALQHIVRLQLLDPSSVAAAQRQRFAPMLLRFARTAAPFTAAALLLLSVLALLTGIRRGPADLLGTYLVLISALTLPHAIVVAVMDRRQRVWAAGGAYR